MVLTQAPGIVGGGRYRRSMDAGDPPPASPGEHARSQRRSQAASAAVSSRKAPKPPTTSAETPREGVTPEATISASVRAAAPPPPAPVPPIPRQIITAPAPPQRRRTPHNLFTLDEVSTALAHLAAGLDPAASQTVELTWATGGSRRLPAHQLHRIGDPEDVRILALDWTYPDASRVRGELVTRSRLPSLTLEGAGTAQAALGACLDHLESLRPQRARWRSFMAGTGICAVDTLLAILAVVLLIFVWLTSPQEAAGIFDRDGLPGTVALCALEFVVLGWLMRRLHRAFAGTRLARQPVAHRTWLTTEFSALVGVLGLVSSTVIGVLALVK